MRNAIKEYIDLTTEEKKELWETATFVFDTNVFLNLYRYSKKTREILLRAMHELSARIWMPHQVAFELMRKRTNIIFESNNRYDVLQKEFFGACMDKLRLKDDDPDLLKLKKLVERWITAHKTNNVAVTNRDEDCILDELLSLFDGRTGTEYDEAKLGQIKKEGKERYAAKIPPGYKDGNKAKDSNDNNAYGDLIVWKQILDYAKQESKSIIFVTHDQKEDWWEQLHGKTIGPRVELRKEFYNNVGESLQFHMYTMESFISYYKSAAKKDIDDSVIDEVKSYSDSSMQMINMFENIGGRVLDEQVALDFSKTHKEALERYHELEEMNLKWRADLAGINRNFGLKKPEKVRRMEINLKNKIKESERELMILREQLLRFGFVMEVN